MGVGGDAIANPCFCLCFGLGSHPLPPQHWEVENPDEAPELQFYNRLSLLGPVDSMRNLYWKGPGLALPNVAARGTVEKLLTSSPGSLGHQQGRWWPN